MAAGFDKNAEVYNSLFKLGFGFVEVGTITPLKQYGNPKPRVFRLVEDEALINRLGFNNLGAQNVFERITRNFSLNDLRSKRVKIALKRLTRDPKYVERVFNRSAPYLHFIVEEISSRNMPMELALLPFVESAYKQSKPTLITLLRLMII